MFSDTSRDAYFDQALKKKRLLYLHKELTFYLAVVGILYRKTT